MPINKKGETGRSTILSVAAAKQCLFCEYQHLSVQMFSIWLNIFVLLCVLFCYIHNVNKTESCALSQRHHGEPV